MRTLAPARATLPATLAVISAKPANVSSPPAGRTSPLATSVSITNQHTYDKLYATKVEGTFDPIIQLFIRYGRTMYVYRVVTDELGVLVFGRPFDPKVIRALGVVEGKPLLATYNVDAGAWSSGETDLSPALAVRLLERMRSTFAEAFQTQCVTFCSRDPVVSAASMALTEPMNLCEWKARPDQTDLPGKLFTCGRPGRATHGRAKVPVAETVIDQWASGLPKADVLYVVSLLGHKTSGLSEFSYYPFRSATEPGAKPTFENWLNARYGRRFVVHEFPTIDGRGIQQDVLDAAGHQVLECLRSGGTTLILDSAGAERTARVCEALGYTRVR